MLCELLFCFQPSRVAVRDQQQAAKRCDRVGVRLELVNGQSNFITQSNFGLIPIVRFLRHFVCCETIIMTGCKVLESRPFRYKTTSSDCSSQLLYVLLIFRIRLDQDQIWELESRNSTGCNLPNGTNFTPHSDS